MNNYRSGHLAEYIALWFLRLKGYRKIALNYFVGKGCGAGEVDIIVCKKKTLVFVEVKKRSSIVEASYAISQNQQKRIRRAAEVFLKNNSQYIDYDIRFDAILLQHPFKVCHLKNAF